jgi:hypothetical protein
MPSSPIGKVGQSLQVQAYHTSQYQRACQLRLCFSRTLRQRNLLPLNPEESRQEVVDPDDDAGAPYPLSHRLPLAPSKLLKPLAPLVRVKVSQRQVIRLEVPRIARDLTRMLQLLNLATRSDPNCQIRSTNLSRRFRRPSLRWDTLI